MRTEAKSPPSLVRVNYIDLMFRRALLFTNMTVLMLAPTSLAAQSAQTAGTSKGMAGQVARTGNGAPTQTDKRRWLSPPSLVRTITGANGDELLSPGSLVVLNDHQLALFDFGNMELRAFALDGKQVWRTGRKGAGPGEFRNAMDVKVQANGNVAVLDMGNRRITTVSRTGRTLRTIPLRFSSSRFIPMSDTTQFGLTTEDSGSFWKAVNFRGDVVRGSKAPASISTHHSLAREMFSAPLGSGAVVTFRWSDQFAILTEDGSIAKMLHGIEAVPFPATKSYPLKVGKFAGQVSRIDPKAVAGALSVTTNGKVIFVLFAGATANRGRIIDVYDGMSGAYRSSYLLPTQAVELVALSNGTFATLRSEPIPSIDIWKESDTSGRSPQPNVRKSGRDK